MNKLFSSISNYTAGAILLIFGLIYFTNTQFMPYHSMAVMQEWTELSNEMQHLILAMMKVMAGGYLSVGILIIAGQYIFATTRIKHIPILIFTCGIIICLASLHATLIVRFNTPGQPPTFVTIIGLCLLILGFWFNIRLAKSDE